jgi:ELWxxDGT repeat protein
MKILHSITIVALSAVVIGIGVWCVSNKDTLSGSSSTAWPSGRGYPASGPASTEAPPVARTEGLEAGSVLSAESQERAWRHLQKLLAGKQGVDENELFDAEEFRIHAATEEGTFAAENPGQEFGVTFQGDGAIRLDSRRTAKWDWSMRTHGTDESAWEPVSATRMQRRIAPGITEWYLNEARGLEQGYTISSPETDPGRIEVSFASDLQAELIPDGKGSRRIAFRDPDGREVLTYHGLVVTDANGRTLPSRMELAGRRGEATLVALHYEARDAVYPVTVDPWVSTQLALFPGSEGSYPTEFTEFQGQLFFEAWDGSYGSELWKSDGTEAGTVLVKDIYPGCGSGDPDYLAVIGDQLFFRASSPQHGYELWVSDGTAAGTRMVADLAVGTDSYGNPYSSWPQEFCDFNGALFFSAESEGNPRQLWKSDGTEAGTVRLDNDIEGGPQYPNYLTVAGGTLYFSARSDSKGWELWKCATTSSIPEVVKDIGPGSTDSYPEWLTAVGDTLYFSAGNQYDYYWDYRNREVWKSDGTEAGTVQVTDIASGSASSDPAGITEMNGELFFRARASGYNYELWKADGMGAYSLVKDILPGSNSSYPWEFTVVGDKLIFHANDGSLGTELWVSDGTTDGTTQVADIYPGSNSSDPYYLTALNGYVYFAARDGEMNHGRELWRSDGTEAGTMMVADIWPGYYESGYARESYPEYLTVFGDRLVFNARDEEGAELWISDGTASGTVMAKNINHSPFNYGSDSEPERGEVLENGYDYDDRLLVVSGDTVYFTADDGIHGWELWASDGSAGGTRLVRDILPGSLSSNPRDLTDFRGNLVFTADDLGGNSNQSEPEEVPAAGHGRELWRTDGTAAGTVLIQDLWPGERGSDPGSLTVSGGAVFFSAEVRSTVEKSLPGEPEATSDEGDYGRELWKTDGTSEGTVLVKDIDPYGDGSYPEGLFDAGGTLYFRARDYASNHELWKSDGTEGGTVQVADIYPGSEGSYPQYFAFDGRTLYFNANDGSHGYELWKSDGTEEGTTLVADIEPGSDSSYPYYLIVWNGTLYFSAENDYGTTSEPENGGAVESGTGRELWKSDGTESGTLLVKDIRPGYQTGGYPLSSYPESFAVAAGQLFFVANDGMHGEELWKTDGTEAGTLLVRDLLPGIGDSCVDYLEEYRGMLVFSANDGSRGREAWVSDGTASGTVLAEDLFPGAGGSSPVGFTIFKGQLLYWAGTEGGTSLRHVGGLAPKPYPDLLLGLKPGHGSMIGDNLHRSKARRGLVPGQTLPLSIANGSWGTFFFLIENDGEGRDRILAGSTALRDRQTRVECHELGDGGPHDVTGAILANRYEENYEPGESRLIRVRVKNLSTAHRRSLQSKALLRVSSTVDPSAKDLGSARIILEPAVPGVRTRP